MWSFLKTLGKGLVNVVADHPFISAMFVSVMREAFAPKKEDNSSAKIHITYSPSSKKGDAIDGEGTVGAEENA